MVGRHLPAVVATAGLVSTSQFNFNRFFGCGLSSSRICGIPGRGCLLMINY